MAFGTFKKKLQNFAQKVGTFVKDKAIPFVRDKLIPGVKKAIDTYESVAPTIRDVGRRIGGDKFGDQIDSGINVIDNIADRARSVVNDVDEKVTKYTPGINKFINKIT